tara:strand:+ start:1542 stop:1817 length:276 start_codon:yes stop_codon:yes gene_type:complete
VSIGTDIRVEVIYFTACTGVLSWFSPRDFIVVTATGYVSFPGEGMAVVPITFYCVCIVIFCPSIYYLYRLYWIDIASLGENESNCCYCYFD